MTFCSNLKSTTTNSSTLMSSSFFSQAFHQTPCDIIFDNADNNKSVIGVVKATSSPVSDDIGLISCTESLGFESSDEIISNFDDLSINRCDSIKSNEDDYDNDDDISSFSSFSSSSSSSSSSTSCSGYCYKTKKWQSRREKTTSSRSNFPPPLTSMSENGRRNFVLKPVRKDGRLEIVGVRIESPEILCASRRNGRLTLRFVKTVEKEEDCRFDNDDRENEDEVEDELVDDDDDEGEKTGAERENEGNLVENGEKTGEERENVEETGEERENGGEWRITAGVRRCYRREMNVWGPQQVQQQRCVTTM